MDDKCCCATIIRNKKKLKKKRNDYSAGLLVVLTGRISAYSVVWSLIMRTAASVEAPSPDGAFKSNSA